MLGNLWHHKVSLVAVLARSLFCHTQSKLSLKRRPIQKLHSITKRFYSIKELKQAIDDACQEKVSVENFGYIEPGRGAKGKKRWLASTEDLEDMYRVHRGKVELLLWCNASDQASRRRAHS